MASPSSAGHCIDAKSSIQFVGPSASGAFILSYSLPSCLVGDFEFLVGDAKGEHSPYSCSTNLVGLESSF